MGAFIFGVWCAERGYFFRPKAMFVLLTLTLTNSSPDPNPTPKLTLNRNTLATPTLNTDPKICTSHIRKIYPSSITETYSSLCMHKLSNIYIVTILYTLPINNNTGRIAMHTPSKLKTNRIKSLKTQY